ncbi:sel1 repeat family protein [Histomonas meleagridis]|uniref:sel1 repeat family protein n=1 Tax=Histomonas meleagridis TaxID=135588 RepID=UPI003559E40A|nr:sel1 repeat family protein [Histomonas meleagridis]KAH0798727.1 sel1 repeat family protein [Histomonas meleagridis]
MYHGENFSSRRINECRSLRITLRNITGFLFQEPQTFCAKIHFPHETEEYTTPFVNSTDNMQFNFRAHFIPDEYMRNDLEILFEEPLVITLFMKFSNTPTLKKVTVFKFSLIPLIFKKNVMLQVASFSTILRKKSIATIECSWDLTFDRNNRRRATMKIFSSSDFISLQNISSGRSSTFELVKSIKTGEIFAKKTLLNDKLKSLNNGQDHESDALVTFNHPSILHIVGFINRNFLRREQSAIIMDYIPNGSLISLIQSTTSPLGWNSTKKSIIIYGIAYGLQLLHTNGLMHNDLRTSSILLDENFEPKIGDIGLIRHDDENDLNVNDLVFKSPEILFHKSYDYSTDVYSFGMIIYHLYTSHFPYEGITAPELIFNIMHGIKPILPINTPKHLKELINSCISFDPKQRPKLNELVKNRKLFIFPGTDRLEYESFCDRISQRIVKNNNNSIIQRIKTSALKGNGYSQYIYGLLMKKENINVSNYFKLSADQGIVDSEYNYGIMLFEGIEIAKNKYKSIEYFLYAKNKGHEKAALNLGLMLAEGKYIPKNDREAIKLFDYSANKGNPKAQLNLGLMFHFGRGVRKNEVTAIHYYKMAALQDDPQAQYNLAILLSKGRNSLRNINEANRYLKRAADKGLVKAMFSMGISLLEGNGMKKNIGKSSHYFKVAADCGLPNAQLNIGIMLLKGQGIAKDVNEAIKYLKLAASNGELDAMVMLGMMLLKGKNGVKRNYVKAAKFLGDAAALGNTKAMVNIGMMFLKGTAVPKDEETAVKCFKMAAAKGNENAKRNLRSLISRGKVKIND